MTPCPTLQKRCYGSHRLANKHVKRVRKRTKVRLYAYRCICGQYHVTRQTQWPLKEGLVRVLWQVMAEV